MIVLFRNNYPSYSEWCTCLVWQDTMSNKSENRSNSLPSIAKSMVHQFPFWTPLFIWTLHMWLFKCNHLHPLRIHPHLYATQPPEHFILSEEMVCDRKWIPRAGRILPLTHSPPRGQRAWSLTRMNKLLLSPSLFVRKSCKQHPSSQKQNNLRFSVYAFFLFPDTSHMDVLLRSVAKDDHLWNHNTLQTLTTEWRHDQFWSVKSVTAFARVPSSCHIWSIKVAASSSIWSTMPNLVRNSCKQH